MSTEAGATGLTAQDVADYFLANVDDESGDNISNLKLQKLIYYAQGFHLATYGSSLFEDAIKAWEHGPVVAGLYHRYKDFGAGAIPPPRDFDLSRYSDEIRDLLDEVAEVCGQFSPLKLRAMTHEEPPWRETPRNGIIPRDKMKKYFRTLVINEQEASSVQALSSCDPGQEGRAPRGPA